MTAALADVVSLLPALQRSDAKHLLRKTAIKTSTNLVSEMNGVGVVNHYKMLRVAQRLADKGYPQNRHLLTTEQIYDFRAEAQELFTMAKQTSDPQVKLQKLRRAFFLDADNVDIRTLLADTYRQAGLEAQALFYDVPEASLRHADVRKKFIKRAGYAGQEKLLIKRVIDDINFWIKSKRRDQEFAYLQPNKLRVGKEIKAYSLIEAQVVKSKNLDDIKKVLRLAEDKSMREQRVLPLLAQHARDNNLNDLLQLLQAYTRDNYPALQL